MKFNAKFFRKIKKVIKLLRKQSTKTINFILLFFVYVFGIGTTAIIAKLIGKKFFETKILDKKESYWQNTNLKKKSIKEYYRQF